MEKVKKQGMESLFVSYELALLAKEKGFDEPCFAAWFKYTILNDKKIELTKPKDSIYGENFLFKNSLEIFIDNSISGKGDGAKCSAPLYQQLVDWFREKHKLYIEVSWITTNDEINHKVNFWYMITKEDVLEFDLESPKEFDSYYEALNKALTEAFKLI